MKKYAGVGSREAEKQPDLMRVLRIIGKQLAELGYVLRSGGAAGCDTAFHEGAKEGNGSTEIFYKDFPSLPEAWAMAESIHPNWQAVLAKHAGNYHARNCHQILGKNLDDPVDFVVCWTPTGKPTGGTRTAIILAEQKDIRVFNIEDELVAEDFRRFLNKLREDHIWETATKNVVAELLSGGKPSNGELP